MGIIPHQGKYNRQPENSVVANNGVNDILLNETQQVSDVREAPDVLNSDCDENDLYQVKKMRLENTREKLELRKCAFEWEQKIHMGLKSEIT